MFKKILIANRGEIACRVMRTARRMGIETVAVYSEVDVGALHVRMADEAYELGSAAACESYLNIKKIVDVCKASNVDAVHPGYGFLSENPVFVEALEAEDITFIGPSAKAMRAMGLKDAAKELMIKTGVSVVPGYQGEKQDISFLASEAEKIGYPVLIKARAGGGGKGMRLVTSPKDFKASLESAQREGLASFGDGHVLIEKYLEKPRHIEVQIFGDNFGNVVHLFERDCSAQRRHQKVIEEAPAPGMTKKMRQAMGEAAIKVAKAVDYSGAGTVEFIVDVAQGLKPDQFYFMEMNTRLQVEHPVTECITGYDLVEWQLRVAAGVALPVKQKDINFQGWAIEARVYAEDVSKGFLPATGSLIHLSMPENADGLRIDSGVAEGDVISPYYDPMIAKLIAHGADREQALNRMREVLKAVQVVGVKTNVQFLSALCGNADFVAGDVHTHLIEQDLDEIVQEPVDNIHALALGALSAMGFLEKHRKIDPWDCLTGWRQWGNAREFVLLDFYGVKIEVAVTVEALNCFSLEADGSEASLEIGESEGYDLIFETGNQVFNASVVRFGQVVTVFLEGNTYNFGLIESRQDDEDAGGQQGRLIAPMPGVIKVISGCCGQMVRKGDVLVLMEAMKMEHSLQAPYDGIVNSIKVAEGDTVEEGAVLLIMESEDVA